MTIEIKVYPLEISDTDLSGHAVAIEQKIENAIVQCTKEIGDVVDVQVIPTRAAWTSYGEGMDEFRQIDTGYLIVVKIDTTPE